jgi:repressor LexA
MYEDLNSRQIQILDFIRKEIKQKGYPPAVREIGEAVGLSSSSTVHNHLNVLEDKGYIRRDPTKPRAIEVLIGNDNSMPKKELINVPIVGRVTAGQPILAVENVEDTFPLPKDFVRNENVFMLTVRGESMIEAGILDEDYVLVRQQNTARNGDIIVALIDDEATVKRFFKERDHIRLQPENQYMEPILVKDVVVLGKVIGVFRRLH